MSWIRSKFPGSTPDIPDANAILTKQIYNPEFSFLTFVIRADIVVFKMLKKSKANIFLRYPHFLWNCSVPFWIEIIKIEFALCMRHHLCVFNMKANAYDCVEYYYNNVSFRRRNLGKIPVFMQHQMSCHGTGKSRKILLFSRGFVSSPCKICMQCHHNKKFCNKEVSWLLQSWWKTAQLIWQRWESASQKTWPFCSTVSRLQLLSQPHHHFLFRDKCHGNACLGFPVLGWRFWPPTFAKRRT